METRTYRHPEIPDPTVEHRPIWRWRFAPHTFEAKRAEGGEGKNDWQYIDRMPKHDAYVGIHPDVEAQQVTARMLREALDDAYLQGELDERFRPRRGAQRRKQNRRARKLQSRQRAARRSKA